MSRAPRSRKILAFPGPTTATQSVEIFAVRIQPSTVGAQLIVECEGPAELLRKIRVKVIRLPIA